ncbi:MAG: thioredoxin domain-containing protein [Acidobacteriota bacterium]|jgi:protein-disulfide isomerase
MKLISPVPYLALLTLAFVFHPEASPQSAELKPEQCLGGELDAVIRIEVFSDFECPACREFYLRTIRQVLKEYSSLDKVCVVYHEFPLRGHKYSRQAAQYAKAAQRLGRKQWTAVLDALYENQEKWSQDGSLDDTVFKALGAVEYTSLKKLLLDPSIDAAIDSEVSLGEKKEVTSTPTSFVYAIGREEKVVGGLPYPVLKEFIDRIVR